MLLNLTTLPVARRRRADNRPRMSSTPAIWSTLRHRQFRALWGSGGIYFIGNAMQAMAAAWMMVELTGSTFLAALVQTAVFLPMFLLSLPAGVLADTTDRRRLILASLLSAGRRRRAARRAAVRRLGRTRHADVLHLRRRLLHGAAVPGLELDDRRRRAARGAAAGDHGDRHRLQRGARGRARRSRASCSRSAGGWNFVIASPARW